MSKFSINKFVPICLENHPETRMTAREIAGWIMENFPNETESKRRASTARKVPLDTDDAMLQQIVAEIGSQRKSIEKKKGIRTTEERPRKYYFTEKTLEEEVSNSEALTREVPQTTKNQTKALTEHDLYPLFQEYLQSELGVLAKRIDERKSSNTRGSNGNRWLFPDIVGMEVLSDNWDREVVDCAKEYSDKKTLLWSFELKLRINSTNLRESFFQTVSNSSWANFGYLVAAEIEGSNSLNELRMLAGLHGIGVIKFDPLSISESQIIIPARERPDVDWNSINRLVVENVDFKDYIRLIRQFYQTGDSLKSLWK